jgi:hypothetical protein
MSGPSQISDARRRRFRRVGVSLFACVLLAVGVVWIDDYTARRTSEAFQQRVGQIRVGMSESEVRTLAGPPDEPQSALNVDRLSHCGATAAAVMTYSNSHAGWISEKLDIPSGSSTTVVCLDDTRRVIRTYLELMHI